MGSFIYYENKCSGQGPRRNSRPEAALFFVVFILIMTLVVFNLYVSFVVLTYQLQEAQKYQGSPLTRNERRCLQFALRSKPLTVHAHKKGQSLRNRIFALVTTGAFDMGIMVLVVLNTIVLMMKYDGESSEYDWWLDKINEWFNFVFTAEVMLKMTALRLSYFRDKWNIFDFVLVLVSWTDFIVSRTVPKEDVPFDTGLFRLFRALRVIKIFNRSRSFKLLVLTFTEMFRVLPYIGVLISLVLFTYAVLGKYLFSHIDLYQKESPWRFINGRNNFRSFFSAIQVLVRCAAGEDWPMVMAACRSDALCDMSLGLYKETERCGTDACYIYFLSYVFLIKFVILNFFVAVAIDNIVFFSPDASVLGPRELGEFLEAWSEFDPRGTGFIRHYEVCDLLRLVRPPLGMGIRCPKTKLYARMVGMNMFLRDDGCVSFNATLFQLCRTSLHVCTAENNLSSNIRKLRALIRNNFPDIQPNVINCTVPKLRHQERGIAKLYCAKLIYENYKHIRERGDSRHRYLDDTAV